MLGLSQGEREVQFIETPTLPLSPSRNMQYILVPAEQRVRTFIYSPSSGANGNTTSTSRDALKSARCYFRPPLFLSVLPTTVPALIQQPNGPLDIDISKLLFNSITVTPVARATKPWEPVPNPCAPPFMNSE